MGCDGLVRYLFVYEEAVLSLVPLKEQKSRTSPGSSQVGLRLQMLMGLLNYTFILFEDMSPGLSTITMLN